MRKNAKIAFSWGSSPNNNLRTGIPKTQIKLLGIQVVWVAHCRSLFQPGGTNHIRSVHSSSHTAFNFHRFAL